MMRWNTSASNLHRRQLCPGSAAAEATCVDDLESKDATTGSLLHYYDSIENEDGESISQAEFLKRNREIREAFMASARAEMGIPEGEPCVILRENQEYWFKDDSGNPLFPGHPDLTIYFGRLRHLFVFDTKTGRRKVQPASQNSQLRAYITMMADAFGDYDIETATGIITQPLAFPSVHAVRYDKASLVDARKEILEIWNNSQLPDAPRHPSIEACFYCKAKAVCPPAIEQVKELAVTRISELTVPQMEQLAAKVELVEKVCEAFWRKMKSLAGEGKLQHHELKPGAIVESVDPADTDNAGALLLTAAVISKDQFSECRKLSLTAVREHVAVNLGLKSDEAKAKVAEILNPVLKTKQKAPTLVERKRVVMLENK